MNRKVKLYYFIFQIFYKSRVLLTTGILLFLFLFACKNEELITEPSKYEGPILEGENVVSWYSDSAKLKLKVAAPLRLEYENGNQQFPKGIQVDFYNEKGENSGRLTANSARYNKERNQYTAIGNVIVKQLLEDKTLKTEKLHWLPLERIVFTDSAEFVEIITPQELLKGFGLRAKQDLSYYRIWKPTGVIVP